MISSLALIAATTTPFDYILDRVAAVQANTIQEEITATLNATSEENEKFKVVHTIRTVRPTHYAISFKDSRVKGNDQVWYFHPTRTYIHEPATKRYIRRSVPNNQSLAATLDAELPNIDLFAKLLALSDGMDQWKEIVQKNENWKLKIESNKLIYSINTNGNKGTFIVNPKTLRITKLTTKVGDNDDAIWAIKYAPLKSKSLTQVPDSAYEVVRFSTPRELPKADTKTKNILKPSLALYQPPNTISFTSTANGKTTLVEYSPKGIYQHNSQAEFSYKNRKLTIKTKDGDIYQGLTSFPDLIDAVANTGTPVNPFLRTMLEGANPLLTTLSDFRSLSTIGESKINNEPHHIILAKADQMQMTLYIRKSDHFVSRISTSAANDTKTKWTTEFKRKKAVSTPQEVKTAREKVRPIKQLLATRQ